MAKAIWFILFGRIMKITAMLISLWLLTSGITFAQVNINKDEAVPFTKLFHNLDAHFFWAKKGK